MSQPSRAVKAKYRARHRETLRIKGRAFYRSYRNTDKHRDAVLLRRYGITSEQYRTLLELQRSLCAICEQPEKICRGPDKVPQSLAVDHDHHTGKVRGLLCYRCNRTLGIVEKDLQLTNKILTYLNKTERS